MTRLCLKMRTCLGIAPVDRLREGISGICHCEPTSITPWPSVSVMSAEDDKAAAPKHDRRTWDKSAYAKKALERLAAIEAGEDPDKQDPADVGIFQEAPAHLPRVPGSERAFLQTRETGVNFDASIGVKQVCWLRVNGCAVVLIRTLACCVRDYLQLAPTEDPLRAGGYYCPVCECTLKDSASYLDHINGKRRTSA